MPSTPPSFRSTTPLRATATSTAARRRSTSSIRTADCRLPDPGTARPPALHHQPGARIGGTLPWPILRRIYTRAGAAEGIDPQRLGDQPNRRGAAPGLSSVHPPRWDPALERRGSLLGLLPARVTLFRIWRGPRRPRGQQPRPAVAAYACPLCVEC